MNLAKRQPTKGMIYNEQAKKLRKLWYQGDDTIACIEDLSNELFFEIFDYLDGCEIYESFSNLNRRFQDILSSSTLRLKINLLPFLESNIQNRYMEIISQHNQRIISLRLMYSSNIDRFFTLMTFDSSLHRLQTLILIDIKSDDLLQRLSLLTSLPRLLSLVLCVGYSLKSFSEMYELIFSLPVLKYITLSSEAYEPFIPLPIATDDQFSTIEYLNINHSCSLNDLIAILSFTPRLNRLTCKELIKLDENIGKEVPLVLSNLTRICISECYLIFDKLEPFMRKIASSIRIFRISTYWDEAYLDADRWERLILQYMPHLQKFYFQHHEFIDDDFKVTRYHTRINQFISSFWVERRLVFELEIDVNDSSWSEIIYSIHPYRKRWYQLHNFLELDTYSNQDATCSNKQMAATSAIRCIEDIELIVTAPFFREYKEFFIENTISLFALMRITRLDALYSGIFIGTLIDLIDHLPNLTSLRVWSLSLTKPRYLSVEEVNTFRLVSNNNKITKVNIQWMTDLAQIQFLIDLCLCVQYLEIGCSSDINFESLVGFIVMKDLKYIRHLCLCSQKVNDKMVEELQEMINFEKLRRNYTIKRLGDKIYLQ